MTIALPAVTTPAPPDAPARAPPRRALGRKLALALIGLVGFVLIANGAGNLWLNYREARATAVRLQREKAQAAAERIGLFVAEIESQIGWTTRTEWSFVALDQRRYDFIRLLRQAPAITELMQVDAAGKEQLRLSRLEPDVVASGADLSADPRFAQAAANKIWFSPVTFRHGSEPYMTIAMAQAAKKPGVTIAEVNLKLIWDAVSAIRVGETGNAYVVDGKGKLVAHPDISLVLRETDLSQLPQVAAALALPGGGPPRLETDSATAPEGGTVLTAHAAIPRLGWTVFVQQPLREALAPLYASLIQSAVLLGIGLLLASLLGLYLARRIVAPIKLLQAGAQRLGAGDLSQRLSVRTGDEIETLADQFNSMAGQVQESHENLEGKVEARTHELGEALRQQTATADVLKVISRSAFDLNAVLNTLIVTGARLCEAPKGVVWLRQDESCRLAASVGYSQEWTDQARALAIAPDPNANTISGIVTFTGEMIHVEDFAADPRFNHNDAYKVGGYRSALMLPLIRDGKVEGTIGFTRPTPGRFTPRQIELVQIFADQAVIAIQNVRLFEDVQARTKDLTEALEHQTATSDVLEVISRSPNELQPVLDALVASAAHLCSAPMVAIHTSRGSGLPGAARFGFTPDMAAFLDSFEHEPGRGTLGGRTIAEGKAVHIPDVAADAEYTFHEFTRRTGARSMLGVPLVREGRPIGVIVLYRTTLAPFAPRQIELMETFADQAVIAINNVRLFDEVQARTKELSRSVGELKALGEVGAAVSSTLDLQKVQATIVSRAVELAGADAGAIFRYRKSDRTFRLAEAAGLDADHETALRALGVLEMESAMGEAVRSMQVAQVADIASRPSYPLRDASLAAGFHAALILPLAVPGRTLGALVLQKRSVGEFPDNVVTLMQTFASQSVLAIQNARLFKEIAEKSEQLELASQHKSQFLANMSHELRTPLNAILGYAELLVDGIYGELAEKPRGVLERVQQNGKHLLGLINDVLDLSKIEAGQLTLTLENYALPALIDTVVSATASLAQTRGLKLQTSLAPDLPHGHGDARRLTQVLLNLVGNAIKFTDTGEVRIDASCADGRFRIAVIDTGPGIAEQDQKRIFEEFRQIDNTSTRNKGGSGLGLAISTRIVEMHGGQISVSSALGAGSTFTIDLPVRAEAEAASS